MAATWEELLRVCLQERPRSRERVGWKEEMRGAGLISGVISRLGQECALHRGRGGCPRGQERSVYESYPAGGP